jgi:hypothetical protein
MLTGGAASKVERFDSRLRQEGLSECWFLSLEDAEAGGGTAQRGKSRLRV